MPNYPTIAVLSRHRHPRLRYVLKELGRDLGWHFRLMTDFDRWKSLPAEGKVSYGEDPEGVSTCNWPSHSFMCGSNVVTADLEVSYLNGLPCFFDTPDGHDLLAMMFYQLARCEEYEPFGTDAHGRFPASESHAQRNGYLLRPVVREWAATLASGLRAVFPDLSAPKHHRFRFVPTYDIDLLWAWKYRGWRGAASALRDLLTGHPRRAGQRLFGSGKRDPYDTLAFLEALHKDAGNDGHPSADPIYFWLLANNDDRRDPNPFPVPEEQRETIRRQAGRHTIGIHPSYLSSERPELIAREAERLRDITGKTVLHSRQHFLRFRLPDTYRALRNAGIIHDYSMGYADAVGWRAGTNLPFMWYDLEKETATGLTIHPFAAMDVTLKNYLGQQPEAAKVKVTGLAGSVRPYGGPFMLLWHNSSFDAAYGWEGWRRMYVELVKMLTACQKPFTEDRTDR